MSLIEYLKKNKNNNDEGDKLSDRAFVRSIAISFFAIVMFIIIFSTSTFAWYRESVQTTQTIQASVYILDITAETVQDEPIVIIPSEDNDGNKVYTLSANTEYSFSVFAVDDESTNASTGYIKIIVDGVEYYSEQIDRGDTLEFTLSFSSEKTITIIERWGTSSVAHTDRAVTQGGSYLDMIEN